MEENNEDNLRLITKSELEIHNTWESLWIGKLLLISSENLKNGINILSD